MTTPIPAEPDPWVNVESFHRSGDRDDTASFARALARHAAVRVPPRFRPYELRAESYMESIRHGYGVMVPGGRRIRGGGRDTVIRTILPDASDMTGAGDDFHRNTVSHFLTEWGASDIEFSDLLFTGEGPVVTPANHLLNLQPNVIALAWNRGARGAPATDVRIRRCHFERQYGFPVHQAGGGHGIEYVENTHTDCMNGPNLNADHILAARNRFVRSEGFECDTSYSWFVDNEFSQMVFNALSIGDNQTPGEQSTSVIVMRNTIDGVLWPFQREQPPSAVVIADNMRDVLVAENTILRAAGIAIHVKSQRPREIPTEGVRILRNTLLATGIAEDHGRPNPWARYPIYITLANDVEVSGNTIADHLPGETPGRYAAKAGVFAQRGGRGLRIGPNEIRIAGAPFDIPADYAGLEWIGDAR